MGGSGSVAVDQASVLVVLLAMANASVNLYSFQTALATQTDLDSSRP